ncbi:U3 small nucleolar RNA-associated protein [Ascosphaera acerosa]|nr:U3 small nucleolar RNA-associated protein [Ascosphaera acerosa]
MDVHRCRFVPYNPQAINALAFTHPSSAETPGRGVPTLRLAIGRANGDIEIWNPQRGSWVQETILRGGKDRTVEGLAWTIDPVEELHDGTKLPGKIRLFSIGASEAVTEWDLATGMPARHSSGNIGEIWSLAAQPAWKPHRRDKESGKLLGPADGEDTTQHLAVGCADGSIVILSTADGDLKYLKTMRPSTKRARVLSVAFQNRHTIVAGYADSTIRVYDLRSSRLLRTVTLGNAEGRRELLVWAVKCLPDGGIVSGDSSGEIRFWDGKNYSLIQRIAGHQADVLDLAVSADGQTVMSGGADARTAVYRLKGGKAERGRRWHEVMHRRYHTHDVKSFAVYETKDISILVSGGLDTVPIVMPLREFGAEHHRKLSPLPQVPQVVSAASTRLVMGWWDREVNLWRISRRREQSPPHELVGKILLLGDENLSAAAISQDGSLVVAASTAEVKMFALRRRPNTSDDDGHMLKVSKVELPQDLAMGGARAVLISSDRKWLVVVRPNSDIVIARLIVTGEDSSPTVSVSPQLATLTRAPRHERHAKEKQGTHGLYERTINSVAFSTDSRYLACSDLSGCIDTWRLEDVATPLAKRDPRQQKSASSPENSGSDSDSDDDSDDATALFDGQRWTPTPPSSVLPRNPTSLLFITFRPPSSTSSTHERLVAVTADHCILEFDVRHGKLSDWSRRNPKGHLPVTFRGLKDRAMGAVWDVQSASGYDRLWLYGANWLWMFDMAQDLPPVEDSAPTSNGSAASHGKGKRKRADTLTLPSPAITTNTGAGDSVALAESYVGVARKMRRVQGVDANSGKSGQWITLRGEPAGDELAADEASDRVASVRRQLANGSESVTRVSAQSTTSEQPSKQTRSRSVHTANRTTWHTLKYREMMAVLPLAADRVDDMVETDTEGGISDADTKLRSEPSLEIAVIERPMWDVDLPSRYVRDYE